MRIHLCCIEGGVLQIEIGGRFGGVWGPDTETSVCSVANNQNQPFSV